MTRTSLVGIPFVLASVLSFALVACSDGSSGSPATTTDSGTTPPVDSGTTPDKDAGADAGECPSTGSGTLEVEITGLPAGVDANVTVAGESGPVKANKSLTLPGGVHAVSAVTVIKPDPIVRTVFEVTKVSAASVCVKTGASAKVSVTYSPILSSHALWLTHGNATGQVASLPGDSLAATGTATATTFEVGTPNSASVAFDKKGNLWMSAGAGEVRRIPAAQLGAGGTKTPDVILTSADFTAGVPGPGALAFDKNGNLWIGLVAQKKVIEIPAAQLDGADATPAVTLEGSGDTLDGIGALAFDKNGNLFVAANDRVLRYDAAHLAASSTAAPELAIEAKTPQPVIGTLSTPSGFAFDGAGNLWVAYFASNKVARLTPAELGATGTTSITPAIQVGIAVTAILEEIALDESGGLWMTYANGKVARLAPNQLTASANDVAPATIITGTGLGDPKGVAMFPAPAALPLYAALP